MDARATQLADVLLHHSLKVKEGDKLIISVSDFTAMELLQECYRMAIQDGAEVELDVLGIQSDRGRSDAGSFVRTFLQHASEKQLTTEPSITNFKVQWAEKFLSIVTVHDDLFLAGIDPKRIALWRGARQSLLKRIMPKTWVVTQFPTPAMAKRAEMNLEEFTDFYYRACLINYPEEAKWLQRLQDVLDTGKRVRIVAPGTDLLLGIEGRLAAGTNLGRRNVPDGECFIGPEENVTDGHITFELPQLRDGNEVSGIKLEFKGGVIVKASAETGENFLLEVLDHHPGNRRLGELGIGMNRGITRYMQQTLFDEKIAGTIHMALGQAYPEERGGGKNEGTIHWDLVKDLRVLGTVVTVDDRAIIKDGEVLV